MLTKMISRLGDISLRAKITISFVLIVICGTAISTFLGSKIITRSMLDEAQKQIRHALQAADMVYAARLETVRKSIVGAAETEQLAAALASGRKESFPQVLAHIRDENSLQFLAFIDARSRGIVRASQTNADQPNGNTPPVPDLINQAMSGKVVADTELLSGKPLFARIGPWPKKRKSRLFRTTHNRPPKMNSSKMGWSSLLPHP